MLPGRVRNLVPGTGRRAFIRTGGIASIGEIIISMKRAIFPGGCPHFALTPCSLILVSSSREHHDPTHPLEREEGVLISARHPSTIEGVRFSTIYVFDLI